MMNGADSTDTRRDNTTCPGRKGEPHGLYDGSPSGETVSYRFYGL